MNQRAGALSVTFTDEPVHDVAAVNGSDIAMFGRFFRRMLAAGINFAPSVYEACSSPPPTPTKTSNHTLNAIERASRDWTTATTDVVFGKYERPASGRRPRSHESGQVVLYPPSTDPLS